MMGEAGQEAAWRHWTSAEDFYQKRDHRTVLGFREFAAYTQRAVEIRVDPETAHHRTVQLLALVAANLTARWARNVRVIVSETSLDLALRRGQYHSLGERLIAEMRLLIHMATFWPHPRIIRWPSQSTIHCVS